MDDAEGQRHLIRHLLGDHPKFEIVGEAATAEAALDALEEHEPDLVLLDLSLPLVSGLDAIPLFKDRAPTVNIIVLSGSADREQHAASIERGALGFVEKDLDPFSIVEGLLALLEP